MGSIGRAVTKAGAGVAASALNAGAVVAGKAARAAVDSGLAEELAIAGAVSAIDAVNDFAHRQPSRKKLERLAKGLSRDVDDLEKRFARLSGEVASLTVQYGETGRYRLLKRSRTKADLRRDLVLVYGLVDFVDMLFDRMENGTKLSREEVEFFGEYNSFLKRESLTDRQLERIEQVVRSRHGKELSSLASCDTMRAFELLRSYGRKNKKALFRRSVANGRSKG